MLDLVPQSAVKVNDVTVGKVDSDQAGRTGWTPRCTIAVNGDVQLPANAYAQVRQTSLLGEKYVSLSYPPHGERRSDRAGPGPHAGYAIPHIGLGRTGATPEVEEVLGALSLLLNGGGLEQIKTITHELNQALSGNDGRRSATCSASSTRFVGSLDTQKARIAHRARPPGHAGRHA